MFETNLTVSLTFPSSKRVSYTFSVFAETDHAALVEAFKTRIKLKDKMKEKSIFSHEDAFGTEEVIDFSSTKVLSMKVRIHTPSKISLEGKKFLREVDYVPPSK